MFDSLTHYSPFTIDSSSLIKSSDLRVFLGMTLEEATSLIRSGVVPTSGTWADIGAGTGTFTMALMEILEDGKIIALDKNPHTLYSIGNKQLAIGNKQLAKGNKQSKISFEIVDADFNHPLDLPPLDGIIMANSLHYANDHLVVLKNVLASLKQGGTFILIEYETDKPNPPWVPNPIPFETFKDLCKSVGLKEPIIIGKHDSIYSDGHMYVAKTKKTNDK